MFWAALVVVRPAKVGVWVALVVSESFAAGRIVLVPAYFGFSSGSWGFHGVVWAALLVIWLVSVNDRVAWVVLMFVSLVIWASQVVIGLSSVGFGATLVVHWLELVTVWGTLVVLRRVSLAVCAFLMVIGLCSVGIWAPLLFF